MQKKGMQPGVKEREKVAKQMQRMQPRVKEKERVSMQQKRRNSVYRKNPNRLDELRKKCLRFR